MIVITRCENKRRKAAAAAAAVTRERSGCSDEGKRHKARITCDEGSRC